MDHINLIELRYIYLDRVQLVLAILRFPKHENLRPRETSHHLVLLRNHNGSAVGCWLRTLWRTVSGTGNLDLSMLTNLFGVSLFLVSRNDVSIRRRIRQRQIPFTETTGSLRISTV